jgi:thiosulfate reductase cytochrome b subunit
MASLAGQSALASGDDPAVRWQERHSPVARLTHWVRVLALSCLLLSGLQIFNAYPRLHWGNSGSSHDTAWLSISSEAGRGRLDIGPLSMDTTGLLGLSHSDGVIVHQAFPPVLTLPAVRDLASGRRWHFFWAWVFVVNGLLYLGVELASGRMQRRLFPSRAALAPRHLWHEVRTHARLRFPKSEGAVRYNVIQQLTYVAVLFGLLPLMVLTGLAMSPSFTATLPVDALFGGRQSARSVHFITMNLLLLFVFVHVLLVLLAGPWNLLRSMVTGRFAVRKGVW